MKHLILLVLFIVTSSCCSTKQIVKKDTKETVEITKKDAPEQGNEILKIKSGPGIDPILLPESEEPKQQNPTKAEPKITEIKHGPKINPILLPESEEPKAIVNPEAFNHSAWNGLLKKHVSKAGNVSYTNIKANRGELTNYIKSLGDNMPNNTWTREDKLAYWINAYNAMTIDLIIRNMPINSIKDIKNPWEQRLWKLESKWYNLDEIEHQILRKMDEPRIHFGIVCASFSCPKLQNEAFTASKIEMQLTNATKEFLADKNRNEILENTIKLSNIFKWFKKDFEQNGSLIDFLNQYSELEISSKAKKSYKDYNWSLNE